MSANDWMYSSNGTEYDHDGYQHTLGHDGMHSGDWCPCRDQRHPFRFMEDINDGDDATGEENEEAILWEVLYTCGVLMFMFVALLSDRIGADSVMLIALTMFMASSIITVEEGLVGFANEGLLTVLALFVVADGISRTGALDWYMGKLLGTPPNIASAQLRLMIPIGIVSAFLNNTPVVAVMIPITQRWARNIGINVKQLLIPLSFASILGGTCTLIGTSTNLVVVGLLNERYPDDPSVEIGLFDLGQYGLPIAMAGMSYLLLFSPYLLPGGRVSGGNGDSADNGAIPMDSNEDILLGARLTPWSPAAGRSVKRSGLRDTGGIYLVSVHRAATGNVHRAVGQEFVLNVGDILYFTGLVEGFGDFCEEHGMEVLTSEINNESGETKGVDENNLSLETSHHSNLHHQVIAEVPEEEEEMEHNSEDENGDHPPLLRKSESTLLKEQKLLTVVEGAAEQFEDMDDGMPLVEIGVTKESLLQADEAERSRSITRMIDIIRGVARDEPMGGMESSRARNKLGGNPMSSTLTYQNNPNAHKVVVTSDSELVIIGVNANDRPGLLLDISKGLLRLDLSLRHTEASVVGQRSISIWRCELLNSELPDLEEIWSVLNALLENDSGSQAVKQRGLRVIRAVIPKTSNLVGKTIQDIDFRVVYKAAIVAVQKGGRNVSLSGVVFGSGDVLVLQASDDSPLLKPPPADFYKKDHGKDAGTASRASSVASFVNRIARNISMENVPKKLQQLTHQTMQHVGVEEQNNEMEGRSQKSGHLDVEGGKTITPTASNVALDDEDDGGFFIGGDDMSVDEIDDGDEQAVEGNAVMITEMLSSMDRIAQDEIAWKDLQVIFQTGKKGGEDGAATREFLTAMEVAPKSKLANRTVAEIGLDNLPGVFLVSIDRPTNSQIKEGGKPKVTVITRSDMSVDNTSDAQSLPTVEPIFNAISPDMPLMEGDVLWFAGSASAVGDLRKIPGLMSYESEEVEKINEKVHDRRLVEAVIARRGPLVGKTVKEVRFRTRYGAAVIAVHRDGSRVHDHPGKIKLQAGDVLLLEAGPTFIKKSIDNDRSFALLAEVEDSAPPRLSLLIPALVITVAMLTVYTAGVASLLVCALVASILMVSLGILSEQEARDAVNWDVFITIASAFGIGTALVNSGVAGGIANALVEVGEAVGIGDAGLLGAVYLATFLISNIVTNNAAAALLFPIAMDAAEQTGVDRKIMSYCLMLGASASFMSPFGYTTNLLIYGPGGYKYKDFLVIGTPMQLVLWILSILFLSMQGSKWWLSWVVTFAVLVVVVASLVYGVKITPKRTTSKDEESLQRIDV